MLHDGGEGHPKVVQVDTACTALTKMLASGEIVHDTCTYVATVWSLLRGRKHIERGPQNVNVIMCGPISVV